MNDQERRRRRRHRSIRRKIAGTSGRPRLCVRRTLRHIYAQVVDDESRRTVASASSLTPSIRDACRAASKAGSAAVVGMEVARRAVEAGVEQVAFDRGGYTFHGRVKALAQAAREGGLRF